jgi:hypothetical protein
MELGFIHGAPVEEKPVRWEKTIGAWNIIFTEEKVGAGFFYNCICERSNQRLRPWPTVVRSHRLAKEEAENLFQTNEIPNGPSQI